MSESWGRTNVMILAAKMAAMRWNETGLSGTVRQ
jgi:hypothetical protein